MGILDIFRSGLESKDPRARIKALEGTSDPKTLARLARTDDSPRVRQLAIDKITDQDLLQQIALDGEHIDARIAAVGKIDSQQTLADIVKERKNAQLMGACFSRITDRSILEKIANDTEYNLSARRMAVENFADESYLSEIIPGSSADDKIKSPEEIDTIIKKYGAERLTRVFGKFRGSMNAIFALGEILRRGGQPALDAIDYLVISLKYSNPDIRKYAAEQLASIKNAEQITQLVRHMDNPQLHDSILSVLRQIDHPEAKKIFDQS